jgi:predicted DNA-binding transcriptional regulator AlpA
MSGNSSKIEATAELAKLGLTPRMLNLELAAAYLGLSATTFLMAVAAGYYPPALQIGRRKQWDRKALDVAVDCRSGLTASSPLCEIDEMTRAIDAA